MTEIEEKFVIEVDDCEVRLRDSAGRELHFKPQEALMLLDILQNEEGRLRSAAAASNPLPFGLHFKDADTDRSQDR